MEIIGHRGASESAPENTLSSISEAWSQAADGVEVDIRLTKDKVLVCMHDTNTLRTSGENALVSETNFEKLKKLDVGSWRGKEWTNEPIPSLVQVMELMPESKKLFIEVKGGKEVSIPLVEVLERYEHLFTRIIVISFNESLLKEIKQKIPKIKVNLLCAFDQNPDIKSEELIIKLRELNLDGVGLQSHMQLTKNFIAPIIERDKEVHVWTVDQPEQAQLYKEMGFSSITTNKPGQIKNFLLSV